MRTIDMMKHKRELPDYEFEVVLRYMVCKVAEFGMAREYDCLDLADILIDHDVTTIERLPDVVSLARNLQAGITFAAPPAVFEAGTAPEYGLRS